MCLISKRNIIEVEFIYTIWLVGIRFNRTMKDDLKTKVSLEDQKNRKKFKQILDAQINFEFNGRKK